MLNAKYAELFKMQEMSLLLQKENEQAREKSAGGQASRVCHQGGGRRPSPPLDASTGRRVLLGGGGWGRRRTLEAFPVLHGEEMITEQPWPSALGATRLAYRFSPGVGMDWGQGPVLMAPQEPPQGFY